VFFLVACILPEIQGNGKVKFKLIENQVSLQNFMVIALKIPNNKIQIPAKFEMRSSKYQPAAFVSHIVVLFVICKFRSLSYICDL
jgi:hypothetical protein